MALFDLFLKQNDRSTDRVNTRKEDERVFDPKSNAPQGASFGPSAMGFPTPVKPTSFRDVYDLLDELKVGHAVAVDCSDLKETTAIRVLDILSGAIYALGGGIYEMEKEVFMFSPSGLEID